MTTDNILFERIRDSWKRRAEALRSHRTNEQLDDECMAFIAGAVATLNANGGHGELITMLHERLALIGNYGGSDILADDKIFNELREMDEDFDREELHKMEFIIKNFPMAAPFLLYDPYKDLSR